MKAVPLLLLLCIVAALVLESDAWRRRWAPRIRVPRVRRFIPRIRIRIPRIRIPRIRVPRIRVPRIRVNRVFRVRFRLSRITDSVKRLAKEYAKKTAGLVRKAYWFELMLLNKVKEKLLPDKEKKPPGEGDEDEGPEGPECPAKGEDGDQSQFVSNGDVLKLTPTGASAATQKESGLTYSGVDLSKELINKNNWTEIFNTKIYECFYEIAFINKIQPSLVAAIASRETGVGKEVNSTDPRKAGTGKQGGYGIIQCTMQTSEIGRWCYAHSWSDCAHMKMMIEDVFMSRLKEICALKPTWTKHQQLQGAVAAMNYGVKGLKSWSNIDSGTTRGDYSNDVIARAQHLIKCYGF